MPQRNGQNPIKSGGNFEKGSGFGNDAKNHNNTGNNALVCPSCKAEIQPKKGFRPSSLKCSKCGASMSKR